MEQTKSRSVYARVDADLLRRFDVVAENRFQGNQAMTVRAALRLYVALYERFGTAMDVAVDQTLASDVAERAA